MEWTRIQGCTAQLAGPGSSRCRCRLELSNHDMSREFVEAIAWRELGSSVLLDAFGAVLLTQIALGHDAGVFECLRLLIRPSCASVQKMTRCDRRLGKMAHPERCVARACERVHVTSNSRKHQSFHSTQ